MTTAATAVPDRATDLRDHGIAVFNGFCRPMISWRDARTGRDYIYGGIFCALPLIVRLDVVTGRCRSFPLPAGAGWPWGLAFTLEGDLLIACSSGGIYRLDARTGAMRLAANTGQWNWSINRGADGRFYIGTSAGCRLFRYDAGTDQLEDLGRLDNQQKYLNPVLGSSDGYVYGGIGVAASQAVAYHIATGRTTRLLPAVECQPDSLLMGRGRDGNIYARTGRGNIYRLAHGAAFLDRGLTRQFGRKLEEFWARTMMPSLPDGRRFRYLDPETVEIGEGPKAQRFPLKYRTSGSDIFHLAEGPNEAVYASTIMPLYLLRYTPATRKLENLGRGGPDNGEAYSFGHCGGKLYYGTYSQGLLMEYDPAKPRPREVAGAMRWKVNPRLITALGRGHGRPRSMCVDVQQRVWMGGQPEYGARHGGLGCYDTVRKKYTNQPIVIRDQSVWSLAADQSGDFIYGGTTIARGSGMDSVTKEAQLFAWDVRRRRVRWKQVAIPGVTDIANLLCRDGKLYGTTGKPFSFFRFDLRRRAMDYVVPSEISGVREQSLAWGPDGNIYGITWMVLFRWRPATGKIEELYRCMGEDAKPFGGSLFHRGAVIIKGRIYFSCGPRVMSMRLPGETKRQ